MSSLTRRLQIRALKGMGFRRMKFRLRKFEDGTTRSVPVVRAGVIFDPKGEPIGRRWPRKALA